MKCSNSSLFCIFQVKEELKKAPQRPKKYVKYTQRDRESIAAYATSHSNAAAVRKFREVYPKLNESTVRGFRESIKKNGSGIKSRTRPVKLGAALDSKVIEYLHSLREAGGVVNTTLALAVARGVLRKNGPHLLPENGGNVVLGRPWAQSLFRREGFKRRRATTGKIPFRKNFIAEQRLRFTAEIAKHVGENDVSRRLIINWDQTSLKFVPTGQWTMEKQGTVKVPISGMSDKRCITAVVAGCADGTMLPFQLIYGGKTERCHPSVPLPTGTHVTHNPSHYANEETMLEYAKQILLPYLNKTREQLGNAEMPAVLIFDSFRGHTTEAVHKALLEMNCICVPVPANLTDHLQPMDLGVNKPIKDFLKNKFVSWFATKVQEAEEVARPLKTDHVMELLKSISLLRDTHAGWLCELMEHFSQPAQQQIIRNSFEAAGILQALSSPPILDDFKDWDD